MMYGWHEPWMFGFSGLGMLIGLLLLVAVVYVVLRFFRKPGTLAGGPSGALDILKERYARGDIDRETYDRMKNELK